MRSGCFNGFVHPPGEAATVAHKFVIFLKIYQIKGSRYERKLNRMAGGQAMDRMTDGRANLEAFYKDMFSTDSTLKLEDALMAFKDILNAHKDTESITIANNLLNKLYAVIIDESKKIFGVKPLASLNSIEHWIDVMKTPKACDFETTKEFKEAGAELIRLKKIHEKHKGHITEAFRREIIDNEGVDF